MKEILKRIIYEQKEVKVTNYIARSLPDSLLTCREIIIISGIRRCGKSVLINQIQKANKEKDYYFNFDDERLGTFTVDDFQVLHELFIELFGNQKTFYFDEIQNIPGWERFVRRLYDSGNKVFITGSNARLLSKELGTHLTGRYIKHELFPFSFDEFLRYQKIVYAEKDFYTTQGRAMLSKAFSNYFEYGGFPQYLENKNKDYLKSLYESILYKDVMVRNKLTNEKEITELMYYLSSNVAKLSSYNSLSETIGVKSPTTVKNYMEYIENTYIIFQVNKFDYSLSKQIQNPKKIYLIDNALIRRLGFSFSENSGRLLENLVYIALRKSGKEIFYHNSKYECDFLIRENQQIIAAIQVCYNLSSEETTKREIRGLTDALTMYNLDEGIIINMDSEQDIIAESKKIKVIPAWKWFLTS